MAAADLEVVEVMRRRDLDRARALLGIGVVVTNDRDLAADQRQDDFTADQMLIALVLRIDGNGGVTQQRLGARRRNHDVGLRVFRTECHAFERIAEMPEVAPDLLLLDFEVGDRGLEFRVPVDEPLRLVDEACFIELDEEFDDRLR